MLINKRLSIIDGADQQLVDSRQALQGMRSCKCTNNTLYYDISVWGIDMYWCVPVTYIEYILVGVT